MYAMRTRGEEESLHKMGRSNYHENERGSVVMVGWSQIRSTGPRPSTPDPDVELGVSHTPCSQKHQQYTCSSHGLES